MAKALNVSLAVTADTSQAKAALQQLQATLTSLTTTPSNITIGGQLKKDAVEATQAIASLQSALKNATNVQTGNLDLTKFNYQMQQSGMKLQDYQNALTKMGPAGKQAFAQLASSISQAEVPLKRSNTLLTEFWTTLKNTARWQISSSLLHGFIGTIQTAYHYAQDLNESLNNIQIVTGLSDEKMARFAESANKAAKQLSTTTTSYTDAALIYYQQGIRDDKEIASRVETTIKLANVSGQSAEKVSNQMTAIWNNFADGSHNLEYYADVITALGAATASSSEEIATGLSKFAAVADTVGLSYENASAALATITATTRQSADTVGTGLRTLFSRLQSLKLGDTLEDGVDLTKYTKALETIGVSALDAAGNLRSMDDILEDMGSKWDTLNDAQKVALAQTVGGVRQYTNLIALMDNFDFYKENQAVALGSEGTVQKQADIYAKSWEAASKRVKASAQSIYTDLLDDQFFIKLNNGFAGFLDHIHSLIQSMGGLKGILATVGTLFLTVFADQTAAKIQSIAYDLSMLTTKGRESIQALRNEGNQMLIQAAGAQGGLAGDSLSTVYAAQGQLSEAYLNNANQMSAVQKDIANTLLQQQAALVKNVELSAQDLQNAEEKANQQAFDARRMLNAQGTNANRTYADNALQVDALRKTANEVGKIEALFNKGFSFNFKDSGEISAFTDKLQQLKINLSDINSYGPQAQQAFDQLNTAITNFQNGTGTLDEVNNALTNLQAALEQSSTPAEIFENAVDAIINDLAASVPGFDANSEAAKRLKESLMQLAQTENNAGSGAVKLANDTAGAAAQANAAADAMQKLGQAVSNAFTNFVAAAGAISSLAMALNTIKNLINTWKDPEISLGDKMISTATQVGIATMMISSAFSKVKASAGLVAIGTKLVGAAASSSIGPVAALGSALTGTAGAASATAVSAGAAAAALFGMVAAIVAVIAVLVLIGKGIANAIVTPEEHMESLTETTDDAKQAAQDAKNAYDELMTGISGHNNLLDQLNECEEGTLEFTQALINANAAAQELIEKYGMIGTVDPTTGLITFSQEEQQRVQQQYANEVVATQNRSLAAQAVQASTKVNQDYNTIIDNLPSIYSDLYDFGVQQLQAQGDAVFDLLESYGLTANDIKTMSASDVKNRMMVSSGAAYKNRNALTNLALQSNGEIDDLTAMLIDSMSADSDLWGKIDTDSTAYYRRSNGKWINLDNKNTKLSSYQDEYKAIFGQEAYDEFVTSDAYKSAADNAAKKKLFRDAIKAYNEAELTREALEARQQEIATSEVKKYKDYRTRNREGMQEIEEELKRNGSLSDIEKQYLENMVTAYQGSASNFMNVASSLGISDEGKEASTLAKAMKNMSIEDFEQLAGIGQKLEQAFGKEGANAVFDDLVSAFEQGNTRLMNAARGLDLSGNIIEDISEIRSSFKGLVADDTLNSWISSLKESAGGEKGLFESLLGSESFSDSLADLQKTFKKTGKIGAKAILEAADECDILSQYLDESTVNAQGLADALEAIELGDIGADQMTDQLLQALSTAGELEDHLANCFNYIDNFSQDRSVRDIGSFYKGLAEDIQDSVEAGFYGDPQLIQAWGEFFGQSGVDAMMDAWIAATGDQNWSPTEVDDYMNQNLSKYYDALNKVIKYSDLSGMWDFYEKSNNDLDALWDMGDKDQVKLNYTTDQLKTMGLDSQDAFIKYLTDRGVSDTMAEMMTSEYVRSNGALYNMWQNTAANKALDQLMGTNGNPTESGLTTRDELQAFYDQYGYFLQDSEGKPLYKDFETFLGKMKEKAAETGQAIVDLGKDFNYAEADLQKLTKTMEDSGGATLDEYLTKVTGGKTAENWSFDDLENAFTKLGYTAQEAYKLIDQQIEQTAQKNGTTFAESFKTQFAETEAQWDEFIAYMGERGISKEDILKGNFTSADWSNFLDENAARDAARETADIMADAFAEALTNLQIKINDDGTVEITLKANTDELEQEVHDAVESGAASGAEDGLDGGEVTPTIEEAVRTGVEDGVTSGDAAVQAALQEMTSTAVQNALDEAFAAKQIEIDQLSAEHQAEIEKLKADAEAEILKAQTEATEAIAKAQAEADQLVADAEASAAQTLATAEQQLSTLRSEVETLQTNADAAAERAETAEAEAATLQEQAQAAREAAEQAKADAAEIAAQAGAESEAAKIAAQKASQLEAAAKTAEEAAQTAVAAAAAERAAAEGAQAAAEAAASLAADVASQVIAISGERIKQEYSGPNAGQVQGLTDQTVALMTAYAQAGYNDFNMIDWWKFRRSDVGQDMNAPSWWKMSEAVAGTDLMDAWDPEAETAMLDGLRDTVDKIEQHTGDTAQATEETATATQEPQGRVVENGAATSTVQQPTVNNTTTSTTINNQQIAQTTGTSEQAVALVSALKQAGVTADTYQQGETIDQIDWSGLEASVSSALTSALADANNGETLTNEQFAKISAEIDAQIASVELPEDTPTLEIEAEAKSVEVPETDADPVTVAIEGDPSGLQESLEEQNNQEITVIENGDDAPLAESIQSHDGDEITIIVNGNTGPAQAAIYALNGMGVTIGVSANTSAAQAAIEQLKQDITINVQANVTTTQSASGYNNAAFAAGYVGSRHLGGSYQGLATVGELGPELMIHGNQAFLVGTHGRVTTYVQPDDQIFTAAQTKKIMETNPLMRDIPGFSVGYNHDQTMEGSSHGSGSGGGSGGSGSSSTKEIKETLWYPERYHLIERQIDDLTRAYEKLNKAKDRAYGANRLKAINDEIKAHKELMKAQQKEIDEAKSWLEKDKAALQEAGLWNEIQLDENGNIKNFDELQDKYSRAIKQGLGIVGEVDEETYEANEDAKDEAQKKWDLITHYEETLDKLKDLDDDYLDSLYELADMLQELATTKVEIRVNVNQKELDLLEHYIKKIDDNIWATGDVLSLVGGKLANYANTINVYKKGMDDLLRNATNAQGQAVPGLTLETWMAMTPEQRDALNLDSNLMEKIEEYQDEILKLLDNIEDLKTKGLEELAAAFDEVNNVTQTSLAMFDNYSDTISRLKDMAEVQMAFKPTSETNKVLDKMDRAALKQNRDQIKARQEYTKELEKERAIIQDLYNKEVDTDRKELYKEQLDNFDSLILSEQQKVEDLWKNSADAIKNIYDRLIDDINKAFEEKLNYGGFDSEDLYTENKNTRQAQQDETVDDYERLYRLSTLQKKIDKDIDERMNSNLKNNKRLLALQQEIQNLKDSGVEMSEYELELLEKKYAYELAMAELEDGVNAQSTVRFTRDKNGNLGYVFSAVPDAESQYEKEQAAMDALYERQKLDQSRLNEVANQIDELGARYKSELATLEQQVINGELTAAEAAAQRAALEAEHRAQIATLMRDLNTAIEDSAITQPLMVERYEDQNATIRDSFAETTNAIVNQATSISDYFDSTTAAFNEFLDYYQQAIDDYDAEMEGLNADVSEGTEDFEYLAEQQLQALQKASQEQLQQVRDNIEEMQKVISKGDDTILAEVERFNKLYSQKYQPVIDTNEKFLNQLQEILALLNRIDYDVDNQNTVTSQEKIVADQQEKLEQGRTSSQKDSGKIAGYDTGGYTGMWGNWGKLALLHEGEQVFNKTDTNRLLDAAKILRTLDLQADFFGKGLNFLSDIPSIRGMLNSDALQQQVSIYASFPNASSRAEIVAAFSDLENQAYQYANRKIS